MLSESNYLENNILQPDYRHTPKPKEEIFYQWVKHVVLEFIDSTQILLAATPPSETTIEDLWKIENL